MKKSRLHTIVNGLLLTAALLLSLSVQTKADYRYEDKPDKNGLEVSSYEDEIVPGSAYSGDYGGGSSARIYLSNPADSIAKVKSSSKNLIVKVSRTYSYEYTNSSYPEWNEKYTHNYIISYYAKKKGSYKISFQVLDKDKKVLETKTLKIKATPDAYAGAFKSIQYGSQYLSKQRLTTTSTPRLPRLDNTLYTTKKSGKLKVKMNKGYKLDKIEVTTLSKNGISTTKTVKNKKKIKITTVLKGTEKYTSSSGDYGYTLTQNPLFPSTRVTIHYHYKDSDGDTISTYSTYHIYYLKQK